MFHIFWMYGLRPKEAIQFNSSCTLKGSLLHFALAVERSINRPIDPIDLILIPQRHLINLFSAKSCKCAIDPNFEQTV